MSEYYPPNGNYPNSEPEADVNFGDSTDFEGQPDEQLTSPGEYDPSHDEESVPDTAYTYKERNGKFYSITHVNGEEVLSEFVFDIKDDGQQAAFDLALATGQSGEFKMIQQLEYNGEMTTVEVTQQLIIYDTPAGRYMIVESNSRPLLEEEPDEATELGDDTEPAKAEQNGSDDAENNSGIDNEGGGFGDQSGKHSSYEFEAAEAETEANLAKEAGAKLAEEKEEAARKAVADALAQPASDPPLSIADTEIAVGSDGGQIAQELPVPARSSLGEVSESAGYDVTPEKESSPASIDGLEPEQQAPGSNELTNQSIEYSSSNEPQHETNEFARQAQQTAEIEIENIAPRVSSIEPAEGAANTPIIAAPLLVESNDDSNASSEESRLPEPVVNRFETEPIFATIAKEQPPDILETSEATEGTTTKLEVTPTYKAIEPIVQKIDTISAEQTEQPPLAIKAAAEGAGEIIYSRQDPEKPVQDVISEEVVALIKPEIITPESADAPTSDPSILEAVTPSKQQPEKIRPPEPTKNHIIENVSESIHPEKIQSFADKPPLQKQSEVQLTFGTSSYRERSMVPAKTQETITLAGMRESFRLRKEATQPSVKDPPNSLELLPDNESNPDPYPHNGTVPPDGNVAFHPDGGFTIFALPDTSERRKPAPQAFAAEVETVGMVG